MVYAKITCSFFHKFSGINRNKVWEFMCLSKVLKGHQTQKIEFYFKSTEVLDFQ